MARVSPAAVKAFAKFITLRENHRKAKEAGSWKGLGKPDPIIAKFRFCNVRRNDDRVTKWVHEHYLDRWRGDPNLWFALVVARLFNNEDTLEQIAGATLPFKLTQMHAKLSSRKALGLKNFNAAYIVSTNGRAMDKIDYVLGHVLTPLWDNRKAITRDMNVGQLANAHMVLTDQQGLGSFMAAQVLADLKYANPNKWEDFHTFAASGPGSKRGLNRVLGRDKNTPLNELEFRATLTELRDAVNARLAMDPLTAQDVQNCLCEYDKYERARTGDGEPKQLYRAKGN